MFEIDMADVRPSVINFITVGLMAAIFIVLLKWLAAYVPIDGFKLFANAI